MSGTADPTTPTPSAGGARPAAGRRELAYAVLLCLAGAGLAAWTASLAWESGEIVRRDPMSMPGVTEGRTGAQLLPWLWALALVGLAGGGAVLATRGRLRRVLGGLLALLGSTVAAGAAYGLVADFGGGPIVWQWPALCLFGGLLAAAGGVLTALRGHRWPAMGARYERAANRPAATGGPISGRGTVDAWDALDRGEDPTVS